MVDMTRILVPTDFSKLSHHAVEFASLIAKSIKAELSIVHFEDISIEDMELHRADAPSQSDTSENALYRTQLFRANNIKLKEIAAEFSTKDFVVHTDQLGGGFFKGIKNYVQSNDTCLIVIGTTGEESIQEFFTGNHTEQLIENLEIPVLSLQDQADGRVIDVILGLDLMDESYSPNEFSIVKSITEGLDARVHIVNVIHTEEPQNLMSDMNRLARRVGLKNYIIEVIKEKNAHEAILNLADEVQAGLIITLTEARSGLYRFIQRSFATKMTKTSSIPVLTINKRILEHK
jgi:nucleotide-binding universal stress UspA family protein